MSLDSLNLLEEYLNKISVTERQEWAGYINKDVILIMNNIISEWLTELSKTNAITGSNFDIICQNNTRKIQEVTKEMENAKYQKQAYQQTIIQMKNLLDIMESVKNNISS